MSASLFADTLPLCDRHADHAAVGATTVLRLLRAGSTRAAAQLMHQRGMSLGTAVGLMRLYGPRGRRNWPHARPTETAAAAHQAPAATAISSPAQHQPTEPAHHWSTTR